MQRVIAPISLKDATEEVIDEVLLEFKYQVECQRLKTGRKTIPFGNLDLGADRRSRVRLTLGLIRERYNADCKLLNKK